MTCTYTEEEFALFFDPVVNISRLLGLKLKVLVGFVFWDLTPKLCIPYPQSSSFPHSAKVYSGPRSVRGEG